MATQKLEYKILNLTLTFLPGDRGYPVVVKASELLNEQVSEGWNVKSFSSTDLYDSIHDTNDTRGVVLLEREVGDHS